MLRQKSCGAVVFVKNPEIIYLLLQYEAGHWDFVKGNVEPNESEKDTVLRELKEETGIDATRTIEGFKERIIYYYRRQGSTVHKEVVFFLIEADTKKVTLSFDNVGFDWLNYERALEKLTFKNPKDVRQNATAFLQAQEST